jgi:ABC-2 type transport system permease protein
VHLTGRGCDERPDHDGRAPAARASATRAFVALCERDLWVTVRHDPLAFLSQALLQPIFFLFVFGRVLPEIGAARGAYGTALLPGIMALTLVLTALQNTALPLVIEFSFTKEIEDRAARAAPRRRGRRAEDADRRAARESSRRS